MCFFKKILAKIKGASKSSLIEMFAPVNGQIVSQSQIPDEAFSTGMLGTGLAIKPTSETVNAPMNGILTVAFDTGHAYVVTDQKARINAFLHIGIDTVNIDPKLGAFNKKVQQEDLVKTGDQLCEINLNVIRENAPSDLVVLLVQGDNLESKKITLLKQPGETVKAGDRIIVVTDQ